ncbi:GNAT family N-acetyltransferase [Pseudochryseolinea flava]|uniref:BioF2-like acetyltransferase domain-containing protein n=1 Tax=Pseudochryseolinea flava TaxID=2059302 RepID=A0A364XXW3_9BACT|nr:GNAT family N-acetyltransferase [Pseudochryseolinea flava]RAV99093.1 hypothetical protein DQQ10_21090 [Pseudochryseolinea flava]
MEFHINKLEDYAFTNTFPVHASRAVDVSLFNEELHRHIQAREGWISFYLLNNKHNRIEGLVHLHVENAVARSPLKAPFASFEFDARAPIEQRYRFINFVEEELRKKQVARIILKCPLRDYNAFNNTLLEVFLLNHGWQIEEAEVGCLIDCSQPIEENFEAWEGRKFRQAADAGLLFKSLPITSLDEVYLFILACRKKKNYSLSMTLKDLRQAVETFPEHYALFGLFLDNKLVAASVTVRVTKNIVYHFYTDHDDVYDHLSPVVFLTVQLVKEMREKGIQYLDLGTAAFDQHPNFGLLNFKIRLGGVPSSKFTFVKSLM